MLQSLVDQSLPESEPIENTLDSLYGLLCKDGSAFQTVFPTPKDFRDAHNDLVVGARSLIEKRKSIYDTDSLATTTKLDAIFKGIPELNPDDTAAFVKAVHSHESGLLESCDIALEMITAIEKDADVFSCKTEMICTHLLESFQRFIIFLEINYLTSCTKLN